METVKSTFRLLFYVKRNGKKASGKMPIIARITVNKKQCEFSTKIELNPDIWDVANGRAIGRNAEAQEVNTKLDGIRTRIYNIYHDLVKFDEDISAEKIKNNFLGFGEKQESLLNIFTKHNEDVKKQIGRGVVYDTYQKYETTRKYVESFIKQRYNTSDIYLKDINHMFFHDFDIYLKTEKQCGLNTIAKFIQRLRRIITIAKNCGLITADPSVNFKVVHKKVDRGFLTEEELQKIINKEFEIKRLEQVRDIFVFSCYTGLAYVDVRNLTHDNIRTLFDDKLWIVTKRQKTDTPSNIPLLDIPKSIIDKYRGLPNNKLLPVMSNQKMNSYLKETADI